jgi:hypothetical protein
MTKSTTSDLFESQQDEWLKTFHALRERRLNGGARSEQWLKDQRRRWSEASRID